MAFEIPIDSTNLETILDLLGRIRDRVGDVDGGFRRMNGSMRDGATATQSATGGSGRGQSGPGGGSGGAARGQRGRSSSLDPNDYEGPWQRAARDQAMYDRAKRSGDPENTKAWEYRAKRSAQRAQKAQDYLDDRQKTRAELIEDMMMSSRFDPVTGRVFPLIGKAMRAGYTFGGSGGGAAVAENMSSMGFDAGTVAKMAPMIASAARTIMPMVMAAAGPVAIGAAAAAGAVAVAQGADNRIRKGTAAFYGLGSSPTVTGQAMAIAGEDAASTGMALGDELRRGTYGSAWARSKGIYDLGPYGTLDKGQNIVNVMKELRKVKDPKERTRILRDLPSMMPSAWQLDLPDSDFERLQNSYGDAGSARSRESGARYRAAKETLSNRWGAFVQGVGTPAMNSLSDSLGAAQGDKGSWRNKIRESWDRSPVGMVGNAGHWAWGKLGGNTAIDYIKKDLYGGNTWAGRWLRDMDGGSASGGKASPMPKYQNIDRPMADGPETINGSIGGAMGAGWRGRTMNEVLENQRMMVGGFSI